MDKTLTSELRHKILFQILDDNEEWIDYYTCFSKINLAGGNEYMGSGAEQSTNSTIFTVRYCIKLKDLFLNTQSYRIKFESGIFNITDVDDYMFQHITLRIKTTGRLNRGDSSGN